MIKSRREEIEGSGDKGQHQGSLDADIVPYVDIQTYSGDKFLWRAERANENSPIKPMGYININSLVTL